MKKQSQKNSGFTLVELMVTLVVAAILLTIAIPSFTDLIRTNRLTTKTNLFTTALNLARSEAVKRNVQVVVCKGAAGVCNAGANWEDGWVVFADEDNDGVVDAGESIRVFEALSGDYTLRAGANLSNWVAYLPSGRSAASAGLTNDTFRLCAGDALAANDSDRSRSIILSASGRVRLSAGAATCP